MIQSSLLAMTCFIPPTVRPLPSTTPNLSISLSQNASNSRSITSTTLYPSPTPNPQHCHLPQTAHGTPRPPAMSLVRPTVIWFRDDLRLHDHPAIHSAVSNSSTVAALLLVPSKPTRFWCDAARDLREQLRCRGAELHVRHVFNSVPDTVLSFIEEVGAGALHFHMAFTRDACTVDATVEGEVSKRGLHVSKFWTGALHAPHQFPFGIDSMPEDCDSFEKLTREVAVEKPLPAPENVMSVSGIEAGDIPIGDGVGGGGERVGLARIRDYVKGSSLIEMKHGSVGVIDTKFGRFGQFLNVGCVSPRRLWHEVVEKVSERSVKRWCAEFDLTIRNFVVFLTVKKGVIPA